MKLDRTLFKEVKALAGNGSREAKFALLRRIDAARTDLSTPKARENFNACLSKHGRAVVAVCVAATLDARKDRLDCWNWVWAYEVLSALPQSITLRNNLSTALGTISKMACILPPFAIMPVPSSD